MRSAGKRDLIVIASAQARKAFLLRSLAMLAVIAAIYWVGWRSKWARADTTVAVVALDAPKPTPIAPPSETEQANGEGAGNAPEGPRNRGERSSIERPDSVIPDERGATSHRQPRSERRHGRTKPRADVPELD